MGTIRVGIVGATVRPAGSRFGAIAHVPALKALPQYELAAVCTAHEDSARESAEAFGARLAFHDFDEMVASADVDLVSVVVKVPNHHELVMKALRAGKAVLCEWPFAANLAEAEEMATLAEAQSVSTAVGLQARSDAVVMHARELIANGEIGEVLAANLNVVTPNEIERTVDRAWQADRTLGANPWTIAGGHALDALCYLLGEFVGVQGRVRTRISEWRDATSGATLAVDAPDAVSLAGWLQSGVEVAGQVLGVPASPPGYRIDVHGREGRLSISTDFFISAGPNRLSVARGREAPVDIDPPAHLVLAPADLPGPARNVAQAYARFAAAIEANEPYDPDFGAGLRRHVLLDAIERSSREEKLVYPGSAAL